MLNISTSSSSTPASFVNHAVQPKSMHVRRLAIGHADDTAGVTFGGQSYETKSGKPEGKESFEDVHIEQGLKISDTEAVLVTFKY